MLIIFNNDLWCFLVFTASQPNPKCAATKKKHVDSSPAYLFGKYIYIYTYINIKGINQTLLSKAT